ncbi:hypothetical protein M1B35_02020 [Pseudomonas sp. MAFF 302046]|uniref:Uncharacterized protein n=1 Tax=Pseudomonas morbosilactucae TaxID=2938197 RepID=A0ABT0JAR0_9PSED|nr:hypothetical protein [Pseudomonas morbosilactucae]MCK9812959.1 hypothetical protein [Pseudomonas morbosilactucae]
MEIVGNRGGHKWQLGDQQWQQVADGSFTLVSVNDVKPAPALVDLDYLVGARLTENDTYVPSSFSFCPNSGKALKAIGYAPEKRWLPPYGDGSGSRVVSDACHLDGAQQTVKKLFERLQSSAERDLNDSKQIIDLPRKNGLSFFAANLGGHREALFALGREGSLFLWQRGSEKWLELRPEGHPIGRNRLENWASSVSLCPAEHGQNLLLAGDEGAVLVKVDPLNLKYRCQRRDGRSLAGPGDLEDQSFLPLVLEDGGVCLISPSANGWERYPVEGADAAQMTRLSAPIRDHASRRLLWIGEHGYLSMRQGQALQAQWHPWPNGATAMPEQGPPFQDGYGLWQLIFTAEGQSYLQLDPGATDQPKPIKGYRLGTGHLSFKYNIRLERPWDIHDESITPTTREVVYPFIEFSTDKLLLSMRVEQNSTLDDFFKGEQPVDAQYRLEQVGGSGFGLKAHVSRPWNAQWFFFDNALWLYIDSSGALYRWNA